MYRVSGWLSSRIEQRILRWLGWLLEQREPVQFTLATLDSDFKIFPLDLDADEPALGADASYSGRTTAHVRIANCADSSRLLDAKCHQSNRLLHWVQPALT